MIIHEVSRYAIGAALAFGADFAVLALLVEVFGTHYLLAATAGFLAGTTVIYWVSVRYAFRFRKLQDPRAEFGVFATVGAVGVLINLACMYVSVEWLDLHYLLGKIFSGGFTFISNFAMRRLLLFTPPRHVAK